MPGYREDGKEQVVREAAPDSRFIPYYCSGDLHFDTLYLNKNNNKKIFPPSTFTVWTATDVFTSLWGCLYLIRYQSLGLEQVTDLERAVAAYMQLYANLLQNISINAWLSGMINGVKFAVTLVTYLGDFKIQFNHE